MACGLGNTLVRPGVSPAQQGTQTLHGDLTSEVFNQPAGPGNPSSPSCGCPLRFLPWEVETEGWGRAFFKVKSAPDAPSILRLVHHEALWDQS